MQFPRLMSYWCPLMGAYCYLPPAEPEAEVWEHSQLMLLTNEVDDLVLDCLVPRNGPTRRRRSTVSVPMTLHAQQLPAARQSDVDLQRAIEAWVDTTAFVDIALQHAGDTDVMRIYDGDSFVTLELLRAN